jgi:hypothetical protein
MERVTLGYAELPAEPATAAGRDGTLPKDRITIRPAVYMPERMAMKHQSRIDWVTLFIILILVTIAVIGTIIIFSSQLNNSFLGLGNML